MPQIIIDGKEYTYEEGTQNTPLLQFAMQNGVEIPYFCYHPAMSAPTNCRMCLVEVGFPVIDRATGQVVKEADGSPKINWGRKPATSCNQTLSPGMVVKTNRTSQVVEKAQKGVLEFILINHPLDCPICDQAGECPLQIQTYKYGPEGSRFELNKVHKPKRVELGPNVTLDAERCINCTRCTRFTEEISKSNQLSIIARGDKNFPATAPGMKFDDPYSMNVVDLCPVGALTSSDFRFKARVWEANYTPNICNGCSRGCNTDAWVRDNLIIRQTPRHNANVNEYWMCDAGRLDYKKYNENRVSGVKALNDIPIPFQDGINAAANLLTSNKGKTLFIGSAYASLESNFALKHLAEKLSSGTILYATHIDPTFGDNFLKQNDRTPNANGCEMLGFKAQTIDEIIKEANSGKYSLIYLIEDDELAQALVSTIKTDLVVHAYQHFQNHQQVKLILPAATQVESAGIYVNFNKIPQLTMQAKQIVQMTPEMWMAMPKSRLDAGGVAIDNWRHTENIVDCLPSWSIFQQISRELGMTLGYNSHKEIFAKVKSELHLPADLKIGKLNRKESFKQSQFEFAIDLKAMAHKL
jgi:NADH-quinone oxidoreductase subunit G